MRWGGEACVCPRISVILNGGFKLCLSIKKQTSVCHGVDNTFNYKNGGFIEILSLFLHITSKTWVASLCVFSVAGALEGTSQRTPALWTVLGTAPLGPWHASQICCAGDQVLSWSVKTVAIDRSVDRLIGVFRHLGVLHSCYGHCPSCAPASILSATLQGPRSVHYPLWSLARFLQLSAVPLPTAVSLPAQANYSHHFTVTSPYRGLCEYSEYIYI